MANKKKVVDYKTEEVKSPEDKEDRFPGIVIIIVMTEFCERFSYSGMKAFLTIYLRSKLGYSDDGATETYHIFCMLVYVFPIFGGIIADNYLGKYRTILYMLFVYAAGNLLVAVTAIPNLALPSRLCTLLGLLMITIGTGGIKPCVTAFGGDQFVLPQQERHLAIYFSVMYFALCVGSLISKTVSPILRSEIHCFGDKDCYSVAFAAPGLVVLLSIIIFVSFKNAYVMKKPSGNIILDFVKCVSLGIRNAIRNHGNRRNHAHWLDSTEHAYDPIFVEDVKKTLSLLTLFTVLPVFWALMDQMGSRWTLQATKMDGRFGIVTVKPDQLQVIAPIFVLILIPLTQKFIYPFLEKRNILKNPLHKLTVGGVLAGFAFIASGLVEIYLKTTYPQLPSPGFSQLRIFNGNPCSISLHSDLHNITYTIPPLSHYSKKDIQTNGCINIELDLGGSCIEPRTEKFEMIENRAISFLINGNNVVKYNDNVEKSKSGFSIVRLLIPQALSNSTVSLYNIRRNESEYFPVGISPRVEMFTSTYNVLVDGILVMKEVNLESGGVYTIMVNKDHSGYISRIVVISQPNSITMALLLPQYLIITSGEVLFAVTGNEFAFKQAPESMKSVMTASWLLTEAFGNVIIIMVTRMFAEYQQETQFFIYTGLMFVSIALFHRLSRGYRGEGCEGEGSCKDERRQSEILYLQIKQTEDCLDH